MHIGNKLLSITKQACFSKNYQNNTTKCSLQKGCFSLSAYVLHRRTEKHCDRLID